MDYKIHSYIEIMKFNKHKNKYLFIYLFTMSVACRKQLLFSNKNLINHQLIK